MYPETLLNHFQDPRNVGELAHPALTIDVENPACGDQLRLSAFLADGRVAGVAYKTRGCTASIAAGSVLTEWMKGKTLEELAALQPSVIDAALGGLSPESKHVAQLCVDGVKAFLRKLAGATSS